MPAISRGSKPRSAPDSGLIHLWWNFIPPSCFKPQSTGFPPEKRSRTLCPRFSLAVIGIPVYVYIPKFYTDVIGVDMAVLGAILFSVRIFDAVTDPLIGYWSDRTHSRLGRRRPYIAVGAVFVAVSMALLFVPPQGGKSFSSVWFAAAIYLLFLSWTAVTVPYESMGPEITFDYNERTGLFGIRDGFLIAGTLAAAASPAAATWLLRLPDGAAGERAKFMWIAVVYGPLVVVSCWWCVLAIQERPWTPPARSATVAADLRQAARNRPFLILLLAYSVSALGNNLPATLILYYVSYVLRSELADVFLLLYFVTGIAFLPGWVALARRTGKKRAWLASMLVNTGAFAGVFFLGPGMWQPMGFWYSSPASVLAQPWPSLRQCRPTSSTMTNC